MFLRFGCLGGVLLTALAFPAQADDASVTLSADYVTEYVFRGVTLGAEAFQPAIEAKYGPWTAGVWASVAVGEEAEAFANEIDFYLGLGWELGDMIDGEIGATLYHYPQSGGVFDFGAQEASTAEFFGSLTFDTFLSPRLTAFYDMHVETITLEADITHAFDVFGPITFETSLEGGLVEASGGAGLDYFYTTLAGTLFFDVTDKAAIYAGAYYGNSSKDTFLDTNFDLSDPATLSDPRDQSLWAKVGVSSTF